MYCDLIKQATKCSDAEAAQIEDLMRDVIFKSTLDWQTEQELAQAAKVAHSVVRYRAAAESDHA